MSGGSGRAAPIALAVVGLFGATMSAGMVAARVYSGVQLPVLLAMAALGAVLFTLLLRVIRAPAVLAVLGSLAGLAALLVVAAAALRDASTGGSLAAVLVDALRNSGARILTTAIPVRPAPDTVTLPIAATWLSGATGVVLLVPGGGRRMALATVPPLVLLIAALVFVGPNGAVSWPSLAAFVLSVALILAASVRQARRAADPDGGAATSSALGRTRRVAAAVAVLAVLGAASVTAGPALAGLVGRQPVDPRSYVVPPNRRVDQLNPLGMLAAWAADTGTPLLSVRTDKPERIQWATLSTFDGLSWEPDSQYRAAGSVLPAVSRGEDPTGAVHQDITVAGLAGGFLPGVADVRQVRGARIGYDAQAGSVLALDGLQQGMTYQVDSAVPDQNPSRLTDATVPAGGMDRYLALPGGLPDEIAQLARTTAGGGSPYHRALLLEQLLRTKYRYWSKAPSGNGYVTLKNFLIEQSAKGGGRGTSEQFATAFAVMARIVGLPSRVVVGFHAGHPQGNGRYQVNSGDAFAWAEVNLVGHGWVAFDPTPQADKGATPPEDDTPQAKSQQEQKSQQLDNSPPTPSPSAPVPPSNSARAKTSGAAGIPPSVLGGGAGALLLLVLVLLVPLLRARRTRLRLDRGAPTARVLGAWSEVRDTLRLAGTRPGEALSADEVSRLAADAGPRRGTPPAAPLPELDPLAHSVNAVAFGDGRYGASDSDAGQAAGLVRRYQRALLRRLSPLRRLLWRLDPRPLFWRR